MQQPVEQSSGPATASARHAAPDMSSAAPAPSPAPAPATTGGNCPDEPPVKLDLLVRHATAALLSLLIGIASLWMFTRNIDFPVAYHPDEASKAGQVISGERNFNHPLLLLNAASALRDHLDVPDDPRPVTIVGRWTSGVAAAVAVLALTLAAYGSRGFTGLAVAGAMVALCPPLHVYAKYFKEDAALVAGVAMAVLGARFVLSARRTRWQLAAAALLGFGCAMAASGKAVGLIVLVPCVITLAIAPLPRWWALPARAAVFSVAGALGVFLMNQQAFESLLPPILSAPAQAALREQVSHATTGHIDVALDVPNTFCLRITAAELMPHAWVALGMGVALTIATRRISRWAVVLAAFAAAFAVTLSFNTIPFPRYALPLTVLAYFAAAEAVAAVVGWLSLRRAAGARAAVIVTVSVAGLLQGYRCISINEQFRDDSRQRLREWVALNLPPAAVVAADSYTQLGGAGDPDRFPDQATLSINLMRASSPADLADSLEGLATLGVQYVAIAEPTYARYLDPAARPVPGREAQFERRRQLYRQLLSHGKMIWSAIPAVPTRAYANPEIRLYQVTGVAAAAAAVTTAR